MLQVLFGILLVIASLVIAAEVLLHPMVQNSLLVLAFLVAILWALWSMLPDWFRRFIHWLLNRRSHHDEQ